MATFGDITTVLAGATSISGATVEGFMCRILYETLKGMWHYMRAIFRHGTKTRTTAGFSFTSVSNISKFSTYMLQRSLEYTDLE